MKKSMEEALKYYEGLHYNIVLEPWDDGDGVYWVARVLELPHCLIHGETPEEAVAEIQEVKKDWIKSNLERGIKIPEPVSHKYSGQIRLRIPQSLHRMLSERAAIEETSLNQLMTAALATYVDFPYEPPAKNAKRVKAGN